MKLSAAPVLSALRPLPCIVGSAGTRSLNTHCCSCATASSSAAEHPSTLCLHSPHLAAPSCMALWESSRLLAGATGERSGVGEPGAAALSSKGGMNAQEPLASSVPVARKGCVQNCLCWSPSMYLCVCSQLFFGLPWRVPATPAKPSPLALLGPSCALGCSPQGTESLVSLPLLLSAEPALS